MIFTTKRTKITKPVHCIFLLFVVLVTFVVK